MWSSSVGQGGHAKPVSLQSTEGIDQSHSSDLSCFPVSGTALQSPPQGNSTAFSLLGIPPLSSFCHFPVILLNEAYFSFASSLDCPHLYSSLARDSKLESHCPKSTFGECGCLTPSRVKSHRAEKNSVTLSTTLYGSHQVKETFLTYSDFSMEKERERGATKIAQNKQKIKSAPAE